MFGAPADAAFNLARWLPPGLLTEIGLLIVNRPI